LTKKIVSLILVLIIAVSCTYTTAFADSASSTDLTLDQSTAIVKVGGTIQVTATLYGFSPAPVNWSIADPSVATVNANGVVTGKKIGLTTLTASADGLTATCAIYVGIKGIDVSHYQSDRGAIDWNSVKSSGVDFVFVKATEGVNYVDPGFKQNVSGAIAAGLHVGAYHFLRAGDAVQQAKEFIAAVKPYSVDYPLACDVEKDELISMGKDKLTDMVIAFCETVRAAGYRPMIYLNLNWARNYVDMSRLSDYELWFARYNHEPGYDGVDIWQYSSTTTVPGINGAVDGNYAFVNYASTLQSDTVATYTFGTNSTYIYKITTRLTTPPKAYSSNPNAVSVAFYQKISGGYLYKITNVNQGVAQITTTGSDGSYTSFTAIGRLKGVVSDTTAPFTMKPGATYQMKLTLVGGATATPYVSTGNGQVLKVLSTVKSGNSFYVKIQALSAGCTSVYTTMPGQSAIRQCMVTVDGSSSTNSNSGPAATSVSSDTTDPFTMQKDGTYQFKFTLVGGTSGTPVFSTGNGSVLQVSSSVRSGNSFFVKVKGVGSGCTGVYTTLPGQQAVRQCIVTVA